MKLIKSISKLGLFLLATVISFSSCKKQDTYEPTVSVVRPETGAKFATYSQVVLEANITDPEEILSVFWYLEAPNGDTIHLQTNGERINPTINIKEKFHLVQSFTHGTSHPSTGIFKWHIVVSNKFKTVDKVRLFQIGEGQTDVPQFSIAQIKNNSINRINVSLYSGNLQPISSYEVKSDESHKIDKVSSLGNKIFYYDKNKADIGFWDGFTGEGEKLIETSAHRLTNFLSGDELYISSIYSSTTARYGRQGNHIGNLPNRFGNSIFVLKLGEFIFSVENSYGRQWRIVTYNSTTGAYVSYRNIVSNLEVYGIFSLGNSNRIYLMTADPNNSYRTAFWYTDRYLNTMSQLSVTMQGRAVKQNPVMINNSEVWILSNSGLFSYNNADQLLKLSINPSGNIANAISYEYNQKAKILRYSNYENHYFYSHSTRNYIGSLSASGGTTVFLED